jgi:alpha-ketoglutarate-dependent taurine dioxygenase
MQPFNLSDQSGFESWAEHKLSLYADDCLQALLRPILISEDGSIAASELARLQSHIRDYNLAIYRVTENALFNKESIVRMSRWLGLEQLDAHLCVGEDLVSVITDTSKQASNSDQRQRYIPYSNKALSWHTDGYYNPYHQRVQAFILHCQQSASSGGENSFIDPEMIYLHLRRENPAYIEALCDDNVMRIPANVQGQTCIRAETASSVFQISEDDSLLDMRFSQRKRHIIWRDDSLTQEALACLNELLNNNSLWRINYRLHSGEGVICNNVLHRRSAYEDDSDHNRVFIRARYYNRIAAALN